MRPGRGPGNNALITETSLWAVSALLRACPDIVEDNTAALLEFFDRIPFGPFMVVASELRGAIPQAPALAALIYMHLRLLRREPMTAKDASYLVMRKARQSEAAKGRGIPCP